MRSKDKKLIGGYLPRDLVRELDERAAAEGLTRTELLERLIRAELDADRRSSPHRVIKTSS